MKNNQKIKKLHKQTALIILDGWGYREEVKDNAVATARTPYFESLWNSTEYPHTFLEASGQYVGLPDGQVGNSEIGHMTIGAGTVIPTDLVRITKDAIEGNFIENVHMNALCNHVNLHKSTLHCMGLLSDGGVHSHYRHLVEFLHFTLEKGIKRVALHLFTDGRDVHPKRALEYIEEIKKALKQYSHAYIATVGGRYYAMDRDNNWDRLDKHFNILINKDAAALSESLDEYIESHYARDVFDEHIEPVRVSTRPVSLEKNDGVFFFNFRADRARMLTEKIISLKKELNLSILTLTEYKSDYDVMVAYPPLKIETTLAEQLSLAGLTQTHIAETEKFPHATYFLNGGVETLYAGENHVLVPTRKDVKTHDEAPEMRALEIAEKAVEAIEAGVNFLFVNIANPDIVGHTANVPALITALETTDKALGIIIEAVKKAGAVAIVTADHGNAEQNRDENGDMHTSHTLNVVPCIITDGDYTITTEKGTLADLAPTILDMLSVPIPECMTGNSLVE